MCSLNVSSNFRKKASVAVGCVSSVKRTNAYVYTSPLWGSFPLNACGATFLNERTPAIFVAGDGDERASYVASGQVELQGKKLPIDSAVLAKLIADWVAGSARNNKNGQFAFLMLRSSALLAVAARLTPRMKKHASAVRTCPVLLKVMG